MGDEAEAFRREVRRFLAEHLTAVVVEKVHVTGTVHDWGFHRALAAKGWLHRAALPPECQMVLTEEMYRAGAPCDGWGTAELVANTLLRAGSDQQRREIVPRIFDGEILICLGYSEPDSGSDVASARTRAERDGAGWVINGQKMFTTLAQEASYVFLLTRTNPLVPKHCGLTLFLVPTDAEGVEVRPIGTLGGERTNATFYRDVRLGDEARVGEVDAGWAVMQIALEYERQPVAYGEAARLLDQAEAWISGRSELQGDPVARERLALAAVDLEIGKLLAYRMASQGAKGAPTMVEGSMAKVWTTEAYLRMASDLLDLTGASGALQRGEAGSPAGGWIEHAYRYAHATTLRAGTSEIQRSIIAEQHLGLPKSR